MKNSKVKMPADDAGILFIEHVIWFAKLSALAIGIQFDV